MENSATGARLGSTLHTRLRLEFSGFIGPRNVVPELPRVVPRNLESIPRTRPQLQCREFGWPWLDRAAVYSDFRRGRANANERPPGCWRSGGRSFLAARQGVPVGRPVASERSAPGTSANGVAPIATSATFLIVHSVEVRKEVTVGQRAYLLVFCGSFSRLAVRRRGSHSSSSSSAGVMTSTSSKVSRSNVAGSNSNRPPPETDPPSRWWNRRVARVTVPDHS
jgi:hypothetical protein